MFCASVAYPIQQGGTFDFDYFATKHVPLFAHLLGDNCVKFEVQKHLEQPGAPKPTVICTAYSHGMRNEISTSRQRSRKGISTETTSFCAILIRE